ncbi:MAG: hypothetical protein ACP5NY_01320 [Thermocladium sp.]
MRGSLQTARGHLIPRRPTMRMRKTDLGLRSSKANAARLKEIGFD